ncbi:hypothetical protein [Kluyvera sp. Awk 3]|uniref:hypothetical protein n=1 Tax=Kluyvera sp. Awk 3 TaxID=2963956 RepID=UPI0023041B46|nr:hypothetical protein [Kluyvera sp. Awk 3]MDA8489048.1 hypothetical protein [Kluyvera sp. Awk 3]
MKNENTKGSFEGITKEPFCERLNLLLKGRSLYRAAKDWDINFSTLKNYYARPESSPRIEVARKIANIEGVSIGWLLGDGSGEHDPILDRMIDEAVITCEPKKDKQREIRNSYAHMSYETSLVSIFSILNEQEMKSLFELIARKGLDTVLKLKDERNLQLIQCSDSEKDRLLTFLDSTVKKGSSAPSEDVAAPGPLSDSKKAG